MTGKGALGGGIVALTVVLGVVYFIHSVKADAKAEKAAVAQAAAEYARTHPHKPATTALVLRFDGFTPCDPPIDYTFSLDTQGDPISLKFPGVSTPVEYSGKGVLNAPERRTSGPVRITSSDSHKQARVRIWEVVAIPMGR